MTVTSGSATSGRPTPTARPALGEVRADPRLLALAETLAGVGYWRIDLRTRKVEWSDEVYRIHGACRETFDPDLGKAVEVYHPDDRPMLAARFRHAEATGEGYDLRLRLRRLSDGGERVVRMRAEVARGPDGLPAQIFGVFRDVTEEETALRLIEQSEAKYRALADLSSDTIVRIAPDGVILFCSPACRTWGYEPEEIVGLKTLSLVHPDDYDLALATFNDCFSGRPLDRSLRREYRVRRKDGDYVWLEGNPSLVLDASGATVEVISAYRDMTARRALEQELAAARDAAEAATQAKSDFLANMSHELRTPLTSVIGFAGLLGEMALPGNASRYVQRVKTASTALLALINDVLDFSRLEAGALTLDPPPVDIAALTVEVCDLLSLQAAAKGVLIRTEIAPDVAEPVMLDDLRVRQVLNNLVGNAVKFTARGEVTVAARVGGDAALRRLRIEVRDTGPGLTQTEAGGLFNRFAQTDASISRKHGGSGLGLSICRQLVTAMGGEISVDSAPGRGSTFWFELPAPLCDIAGGPAPLQVSDDGPAAASRFAGARVLVVDDHAVNRELVRALLTGLDLSLSEATSGAEAVAACLGAPFDLILMDMQMPEMDGMTAARGVRASSDLNDATPIIALTAMSIAADDPALAAAGLDDVIPKPIDPDLLLTKVAQWLESGARSSRLVRNAPRRAHG